MAPESRLRSTTPQNELLANRLFDPFDVLYRLDRIEADRRRDVDQLNGIDALLPALVVRHVRLIAAETLGHLGLRQAFLLLALLAEKVHQRGVSRRGKGTCHSGPLRRGAE